MHKIIGTTDLQRNFRTIFDEVAKDSVPYILTRGSRPEAALVPYADYLRFQELMERDVLNRVNAMLARLADENAGFSEAEVAADVAEVIREVRGGRN